MIVKLQNVRLSFPKLFTPEPFKPGDTPKYKANFLVAKGDANDLAIKSAINKVATEKWKDKAGNVLTSIKGNNNRFCYQDGDLKSYDGYKGMSVLCANNTAQPYICDKDPNVKLIEADGRPYGGCYVNANVDIFGYNNSGNGISAKLLGVQFLLDGDAFAGGPPASASDFDDASDFGETATTEITAGASGLL